MRRTKLLFFFCFSVLITLSITSINTGSAAQKAKIFLRATVGRTNVCSASTNQNFTVQVDVANASELIGWQIYLSWNASLLELVSGAEGPFLGSSGAYTTTFKIVKPGDTGWPYLNMTFVAGTLQSATLESAPSVTGSSIGTLATLTFRAKAAGSSVLQFVQEDPRVSKLIAFDPWNPPKIAHTTEDGYFIYPAPIVSVEPAEIIDPNLTVDTSFVVNISITNVENLYNWTVRLGWAPSLLDVINVAEGPFLKSAGGSTSFPTPIIDKAGGSVYIRNTLTDGSANVVSGNGTLASVTFLIQAKGFCSLNLYDVKLFKIDAFIPALTESGYFSNMKRDIAVRSVEASPTSVSAGQLVSITVSVENKGEIAETFSVTVFYDSYSIGTSEVKDLAPDEVRTLPDYIWDTTGVPSGSYNITAKASHVEGELDFSNNVGYAPTKVTVGGEQTGIFWLLIIGGVAVVAVIGIVGFFLYRRSKS